MADSREAPRERRARNMALVFQGGNQFRPAPPFFVVPAWWRRFLFVLLSPREFTVYCYICSHMDDNGIAYPTYENIKADLNISNRTVIAKSIAELVALGLLMQRRDAPLESSKHRRNVFQRPLVEYTLWILLAGQYVDGELRPIRPRPSRAALRGARSNWNQKPVRYGLHSLIGDDAYTRYNRATAEEKAHVLTTIMNERIQAARTHFVDTEVAGSGSAAAAGTMPELIKAIDQLPDSDKVAELFDKFFSAPPKGKTVVDHAQT